VVQLLDLICGAKNRPTGSFFKVTMALDLIFDPRFCNEIAFRRLARAATSQQQPATSYQPMTNKRNPRSGSCHCLLLLVAAGWSL
jgi:hypothetical protein